MDFNVRFQHVQEQLTVRDLGDGRAAFIRPIDICDFHVATYEQLDELERALKSHGSSGRQERRRREKELDSWLKSTPTTALPEDEAWALTRQARAEAANT